MLNDAQFSGIYVRNNAINERKLICYRCNVTQLRASFPLWSTAGMRFDQSDMHNGTVRQRLNAWKWSYLSVVLSLLHTNPNSKANEMHCLHAWMNGLHFSIVFKFDVKIVHLPRFGCHQLRLEAYVLCSTRVRLLIILKKYVNGNWIQCATTCSYFTMQSKGLCAADDYDADGKGDSVRYFQIVAYLTTTSCELLTLIHQIQQTLCMLACQTPKFDHWPEYFEPTVVLYHFAVHHQRIAYECGIIRILHLGQQCSCSQHCWLSLCLRKTSTGKKCTQKTLPIGTVCLTLVFSTRR